MGVGRRNEGHLLIAVQFTAIRDEWLASRLHGDGGGGQAQATKPGLFIMVRGRVIPFT